MQPRKLTGAPAGGASLTPAILLLLSSLLFVLAVAACGGSTSAAPAATQTPQAAVLAATAVASPPPPPAAPLRLARLTGMPISESDYQLQQSRRPIAVMIDNIEAAAPQAGLDHADVVIEALVEGGITRFLAVFDSQDAPVIEPVRSARTPFLYWALEYDALYVHVGSATFEGPANAAAQIADWGVADLDLASNELDGAYERDPDRAAPHNVRTSTAQLQRKATALGLERTADVGAWRFTDLAGLAPGDAATGFSVQFASAATRDLARWTWDPASGRYLRAQFGEQQNDAASGAPLAFANVVVQYANTYEGDSDGHVLIDAVGSGRAQVFSGGRVIDATWRKSSAHGRTEFLDADGQPVALLAGPTWIEVVPPYGAVSIDQ